MIGFRFNSRVDLTSSLVIRSSFDHLVFTLFWMSLNIAEQWGKLWLWYVGKSINWYYLSSPWCECRVLNVSICIFWSDIWHRQTIVGHCTLDSYTQLSLPIPLLRCFLLNILPLLILNLWIKQNLQVDELKLAEIGPKFEHHEMFPARTNTG